MTNVIISAFRSILPIGTRAAKRGSASARKMFRGFWSPRALYPLAVSDPAKLLHIATEAKLLLPRPTIARLWRGSVSDKQAQRLTQRLYDLGDVSGLAELERLLSGGGERWRLDYENLVVNIGLDHALDVVLSGGSQDTSWFIGLLAASPSPAAGWGTSDIDSNDFIAYDEASLQAFVDGGVSGQSCSNTASPAVFTCSTNSSSVGGAYLIGTNAKGTAAGTLYAAGAFTGGNKALDDGDTLEVTATFTAADA